jgi:DNA-binding LytR/AlgR family response regulator
MAEKIRVLIADDHPVVREGLRGLLEIQPDIELVGEAVDGVDAIEKARTLAPDVILLDMVMPRKVLASALIVSRFADLRDGLHSLLAVGPLIGVIRLAFDLKVLVGHQEYTTGFVSVRSAPGIDIDSVGATMDGVRPAVSGLAEDLLGFNGLDNLGVAHKL